MAEETGLTSLRDEITRMLAAALTSEQRHAAEVQRRDEQHIAEAGRRDELHVQELHRRDEVHTMATLACSPDEAFHLLRE